MPKANTPEDVSRLIGEAISSGDMDAALSLYEPGATFAMPTAFGEGSVTGHDGLREAFSGFLALNPELTVNARKDTCLRRHGAGYRQLDPEGARR